MTDHPIPMEAAAAVDRYFMEMRCKVIEVAASLDRIQRCRGGGEGLKDYRIEALRRAIPELLSDEPGRTERIQLMLSDHSTEPLPAATEGSAHGACRPE